MPSFKKKENFSATFCLGSALPFLSSTGLPILHMIYIDAHTAHLPKTLEPFEGKFWRSKKKNTQY